MPLPVILGALRGAAGLAGLADSGAALGSAARGVGAAIGGSGSIGEKAAVVGKNVEKGLAPAIDAMGKFAATTFNTQLAAQGLSALGKAILSLPAAPIRAFTAALDVLQAPVLSVVGALKSFRDSVGAVGTAVSEFVRLSNPIHVLKFNLALDDLTASIGRMLTPVLETATVFVRGFADVIFKVSKPIAALLETGLKPMEGIFRTVVATMSPFVSMFTTFVKLLTEVARPLSKVAEIGFKLLAFPVEMLFTGLAKVFELLVGPLTVALRLFGDLVDAIGGFVDKGMDWIRTLFGMPKGGGFGASVGAAVRPATIGSVEDYGRKAQQAAFSLGTAAGPEAKTADYVEKLYNWFKDGEFVTSMMKAVGELVKKIPGAETLGKAAAAPMALAAAGVEAGRWIEDKAKAAFAGEPATGAGVLGATFKGMIAKLPGAP